MRQTSQNSTAPALETPDDQLLHDVVGLTPAAPLRAEGIAVGTLDQIDANGDVLVSIAGMGLSRIAARSIVPLDPGQQGQTCALGFEGGDPRRPIVLGLMMAPQAAPALFDDDAELVVDGERVVIHAQEELELRCGEAAIILSSDGRIQLRGVHITSHASATQRILGGSVNIN
jgi:hypothetical protein